MGHQKPMEMWNVLIRGHHPGYLSWEPFEAHQRMLNETAHMQGSTARKPARGGRALLTGLVRCGRCGRMMRVFYGMRSGHAHRYQCRGDVQGEYQGVWVGVGGIRVDRAVAAQILEAVAAHAVEATLRAQEQITLADADVRKSLGRELEQARYEVSLAARRQQICVGSVLRLIRERILPAKQLMPSAPLQVLVAALDKDPIKIAVRALIERRPRKLEVCRTKRR